MSKGTGRSFGISKTDANVTGGDFRWINLKQRRGVKREILEAEGEGEVRSRTTSIIRRDHVERNARRKIALGVLGDA